jgi:drug/metabolite transporter (DMT)-like permease
VDADPLVAHDVERILRQIPGGFSRAHVRPETSDHFAAACFRAALAYPARDVSTSRAVDSGAAGRDHQRALALLAVCAVLWSSAGVLFKLVDWNVGAIWSVRSAIAATALWALRRPSLAGLSRAEWVAACALAATTGLFILANKLTTAANAILIQYSAPIWVALLSSWLLGERASRLDWLTIATVIGGVTLFFVEQLTLDHVAGNLVALAAGVTFAVSVTAIRQVALTAGRAGPLERRRREDQGDQDDRGHREAVDPLRPMLLGNLLGAVLGAPFVFLSPPPGLAGWGALVALGLFQQAAAYLLYAWSMRHATALEATLMASIEPILSPIWVALAFGERPGPWALAGGAVVLGAITARGVLGRRAVAPAPAA